MTAAAPAEFVAALGPLFHACASQGLLSDPVKWDLDAAALVLQHLGVDEQLATRLLTYYGGPRFVRIDGWSSGHVGQLGFALAGGPVAIELVGASLRTGLRIAIRAGDQLLEQDWWTAAGPFIDRLVGYLRDHGAERVRVPMLLPSNELALVFVSPDEAAVLTAHGITLAEWRPGR